MKKFMIMAALMLSSVGAFAQYSAGDITLQPKVGLNVTSTTGEGADYKAGFVGGAELEYHATPMLGISAGVLYSMEGAKLKDSDYKVNLDYINIPILANVYVAPGFAIKAGIQPAFNLSSKFKGEGISIDLNETAKYLDADAIKVNSFDFSIPVGLSYEYMNVCLDARYNIGVTNIVKDGDAKNSVFQITVGYKFKL